MIVARGLGRGSAGIIVAAGLGLSSIYVPPIPEIPTAGGGVGWELRRPELVAGRDDRDLIEIIPIILGTINAGY